MVAAQPIETPDQPESLAVVAYHLHLVPSTPRQTRRTPRLHRISIRTSIAFPASLLLRHRAARRQHITERINKLYQLRDKVDYHLRAVLTRKQQASITAGDFVVAIERSRYARRCRVIIGPDGTRRILEPGNPTRLTVLPKSYAPTTPRAKRKR